MNTYAIDFSPPMTGFVGTFNTFRLGLTWSKRAKVGDEVFLLDKPHCLLFGKATVEQVITGTVEQLAPDHAHLNHNQIGLDDSEAVSRLVAGMTKRYGPHVFALNKKCTVVYLRMIDEQIPGSGEEAG